MAATTNIGDTSLAVTNSASRLRFFLGQLLTQRDLQAEQSYHVLLRRLMQREILGTGTVAGLEVTHPTAGSPEADSFVIVGAGLALDPDGRELLIEKDVQLQIAAAPLTPNTTPFPPSTTPDSATVLATDINTRFGLPAGTVTSAHVNTLIADLQEAGLIMASDPTPVSTLRGLLAQLPTTLPPPIPTDPADLPAFFQDQLVSIVHLGLEYAENGTEPSPAIVDASCCAGTACFPTRTNEGVLINVSETPFPAVADPQETFRACLTAGGALACADIKSRLASCIFDMWRDLASVTDPCSDTVFPVVPLAVVSWSLYPRAGGRILNIDNLSERPLALGIPATRVLAEVLGGCTSEESGGT
jgi:hypothetical protein